MTKVKRNSDISPQKRQHATDREFRRVEVDLNELVNATLNNFNGSLKSSLVAGLAHVPIVPVVQIVQEV